ncbi:hypothetical protein QUF76_17925 [Desulfobacterales bacterium HSG16]|nr:hypothetical protein [Desulfobacterales bacterium HSG16]
MIHWSQNFYIQLTMFAVICILSIILYSGHSWARILMQIAIGCAVLITVMNAIESIRLSHMGSLNFSVIFLVIYVSVFSIITFSEKVSLFLEFQS